MYVCMYVYIYIYYDSMVYIYIYVHTLRYVMLELDRLGEGRMGSALMGSLQV